MIKLKLKGLDVNMNEGGDYIECDPPKIEKVFDTREEAINYLNSDMFYGDILEYLEDNGEETDYGEDSYSELASDYGASIKLDLDGEQIWGDVIVEYAKKRGYYIDTIEYDYD